MVVEFDGVGFDVPAGSPPRPVCRGAAGIRCADHRGPIGRDLFRTSDGGTIAFSRNRDGEVDGVTTTGSIWDPTGLHRIGWADRAPLTFAAIGLGILAIVLRVVLGIIWRKQRIDPAASRLAAAGWRVTGVVPFLYALVPAIAVAGIVSAPPPFTRMSAGVVAAFALMTVAVAISALLPLAVVAAWRSACWTVARRAAFTAIASGELALAWALWHRGLVLGPWVR